MRGHEKWLMSESVRGRVPLLSQGMHRGPPALSCDSVCALRQVSVTTGVDQLRSSSSAPGKPVPGCRKAYFSAPSGV
jgi:hypothetical protein